MPLVPGCRNAPDVLGGGIIHKIRGEDLVAVPCPNMEIVRLKKRLQAIDPQLLVVRHEPKTPLYQRGEVDLTTKNLILKNTSWLTFLAHFKWVVGSKDLFYSVIKDSTLVHVFVGNTNVKARLKSEIEDGTRLICNSLEDLLKDPDLVVIHLGQLIHSNKAAANILHEALLVRKSQGRPTWLIEPPGFAFTPWRNEYGVTSGMPSCNDAVLAFVNAHFIEMHLPSQEGEEETVGYSVAEGEVTIEAPSEFGEAIPEEPPPQAHRRQSDDAFIEELQGTRRKKFPNKGSWR